MLITLKSCPGVAPCRRSAGCSQRPYGSPVKYLEDRSNRVAALTQTRLRLGIAPLMSRLFRLVQLPPAAASCPMCQSGVTEDAEHFLLKCPALASERATLLQRLNDVLQQLGEPGAHALQRINHDPDLRYEMLLGGQLSFPAAYRSPREELRYRRLCAQVLWSIDKSVKNFLLIAWRMRTALAGSYNIVGGRIVCTPPDDKLLTWLHQRNSQPPVRLARCEPHDPAMREFWEPWLHYLEPRSSNKTRKSIRKNVFRVWQGHTTGLFYKWSDCLEATKGFKDAKFKGFNSLADAIKFIPP